MTCDRCGRTRSIATGAPLREIHGLYPYELCAQCLAALDTWVDQHEIDAAAALTADTARDAFWAAVARSHPDIKTGDFPPDAMMAFERATLEAVRVWLQYNWLQYNANQKGNK